MATVESEPCVSRMVESNHVEARRRLLVAPGTVVLSTSDELADVGIVVTLAAVLRGSSESANSGLLPRRLVAISTTRRRVFPDELLPGPQSMVKGGSPKLREPLCPVAPGTRVTSGHGGGEFISLEATLVRILVAIRTPRRRPAKLGQREAT